MNKAITNYSWSPSTDILPESELILDQILPGATGREEQSSGIGGDRLESSLLPPVVAQPVTPDLLFDDPIQEANLSPPPDRTQPPGPARADQLVGARANQEAAARDTGLLGEYFHNSDLTNPALTRIDPTVDLIWGKESPDPSMAKETFSVRWTGFVQPEFTETYSFITQSDDGVRLWVNGELLIDKWKNQRVTEHSGTIDLEGEQLYDITLEYYENKGNAVSKLLWSSASQSTEIIPTSRLYPADIILSTEPPPNPLTLQFITDGFYNPGETVRFRGKVAGNSNVLVDFSLQKDDGPTIDIEDATVLELDSDDPGYAFFSYELSGLEPGRYQLQALAIDQNGNVGETVIQSFQVLDLPPGQELSPTVKRAIAYSSNLENYSPSQLAETREWTVNIAGDRTSEALAAEIGAENLGLAGPVANSYIWRFPSEMDPWEVPSQLDALQGVQFAYPQVPIEVRSLFVPNDPYFDRQWHLRKNGEGAEVDINVIPAWDLATGSGVAIGVVDDGVQYIHPDLKDSFLPDLSIDLNDADPNPDPIYTITMDGGLSAPQPIIDDGYDWTDFPVFIQQKGLVSEATVTFDFDHPFPDELDFNLVSPRGAEWEIENIDGSGSYSIDTSFFNGEDVTGKWSFVVEDEDLGNQGFLNSWVLELTVAGAHGTAVAGVAVASGNNSLGVSGVAPDANWAALRLTADAVSDRQIADALYADDRNQAIGIYNNSWKPQVLWTGVNSLAALDQGITNGRSGLGNIYVFGAGNDWFESRDYRENLNYNAFANSRYTIAVGAIDHTGKKAWYSQEGASLLISAPSGGSRDGSLGITTTDLMGPDGRNADGTGEYGANLENNNYTNDFDGTSAATPVVSGVIALMLDANSNLSWRDVQHILVQTANRDQINDSEAGWSGKSTDEIRHSYKYGFGVVDAAAAVNAAVDWTPVAPETLISTETMTVEKKIRDGRPRGLKRGANITDDITVESVEVVLDISHEFRGDLEIELISPSGEKSLLANSLYDEGDDYNNWVFTTLRHWGESSLGEWQLVVRDNFPGNQGTLHSWQLNLYGTPTATVSIEATDPIASEDGDPGAFTITRTGDLDKSQIVNYSATGTATPDSDYEDLTGTVEIPAGETSAQVAIIPKDDDAVEVDETLEVVLDAGDGYAIGIPDRATVIITDNDVANSPPTLTLIDTLTGATVGKSFTISYSDLFDKSNADDADGDPISFEISTIASGTLMKDDIASEPGVTTLSFGEAVVWTPDTVGDEVTAFAVRLFDGKEYSSTEVQVMVAVTALPIVTISATDANASEDGDPGAFTITRTGDLDNLRIVNYSVTGTATASIDYEALTGTVEIPAGETSAQVNVIPQDDDVVEGDETILVVIDADDAYQIGTPDQATVTITDNDVANSPPTLTLIDPLTGATVGKSFTISYSDLMAKSDANDADGDPISWEISTIASGTLTKDDLPVVPGVTTLSEGEAVVWTPDTVGDEMAAFAVRVFDGTDYSLEPVPVLVSVAAEPIVTISATDPIASEDGDRGAFTITRTGDTDKSQIVNYSATGTATPDSDYEALTGTVEIPAGESSAQVNVIPQDDDAVEGDETVEVVLDAGTGYKLGDESSASVTIADNDFPPSNIVTNTNNSGVGSLRDAIVWANDNPGRDTITFDIPGDGPHTISPESALPDITEGVLIDGWSENGGTPPTTPLILLDGSLTRDLPGFFDGLTIQGSSVEVRGLVINNWKSSGIRIEGASATDNWIYGNFIGTTPDGTAAASNGGDGVIIFQGDNNIVGTNGDGTDDAAEANLISGNTLSGVDIESDGNIVAGNRIGTNLNGSAAIGNGEGGVDLQGNDNRIGTNGDGTADAVEANLISGNGYSGVKIHANSTDNIVAGNLIGTNRDGTAAIGNQHDGVSVSGNGNIIGTDGDGTADAAEVNLISGNKDHGVEISGGNSNVVAGNLIGTNGDGTAAIANTRNGVYIIEGNNNIIGTDGDDRADAAEANLISGNTSYGVFITSGNSNVLAGNRIGTNLEGIGAIGNGRDGVLISDDNNIIGTNGDGTADAAEANLISGNQRYGVYLLSNDNRVAGNFIGTNIDGRSAIGNRRDGVNVVGDNNIIGGTSAGLGNVIAFNSGDGVRVNTSTGNSIPGNSIFSNAKQGINSDDEPTLPELTSATSDDASTAIVGTFNSTANSTFTLEFFSNSVLDESGYGEGQTFLGSQEVTTGSDGSASFTANFSTAVPVGHFITATATDPDGNTSEFSQGVEVLEVLDIPAAIDLKSDNLFLMGGNSFSAGDTVNVGFLVANNGPEAAGSFNVAFYLSQDDTITSDDRLLRNYEISGLGGGANTGIKFPSLTLPNAGDAFWNGDGSYWVGMIVDSENVISESNEDNNANTKVGKDYFNLNIVNTQLNQPPVATDDAITITQGSTATIATLTNDSDPDDDPLTITGVSTATSGEVSISDNNLVYTPNVDFAGEDSLTYTVSDGKGGTDTATVSVTVEPPSSARVTVTVNQVKAIDDMEQGLLGGSGEAEFFTKLTINGQTWESPFKSNQNHIVPNWQFSQEVTDFTVPITINMHEHDGGLFGGTNDVDINPSGGVKWLNLTYDLRTGQISGDASGTRGEQIHVIGAGDSLKAEIKFTIGSDILLVQPNTAPTVPNGLHEVVNGNGVTLNWNRATDAETAPADLTYNLRVGTTPSGENIMSPTSISPQLAQNGNVDRNNSWTLNNLEPGTYYWSVQAVDSAFAGSEFATEGSFTVEPPPSARVTVTVNEVKEIDDVDPGWAGSGGAEFFTELTINGLSWQSPVENDQNHIVPNWQFSQEVTDFTVPITINMHEHDGGLFGGTNDVDINPSGGVKQLNLTYDLRTGQISGDASGTRGEQIHVRGSGDSWRAEIWFTIDSTFSEDSIPTNHWNAAFINRTNSNVDDRALYNFSNPEAVLDLGPASGDGKIRLYQNWNASPASGVQSDYFAMQAWTRTNFAADKLYKITTKSDDGSWFRLQNVNTGAWTGNSVVEGDDGADWRDRAIWNPPKTIMFKVPETGEYDFYAEFYDRAGEAVVDFTVEEVQFFSESVNESLQWQGQFFWWDRQEGNQPPTDIFAAGGDRNNAIAVVNLGNNTRNDGNKGLSFNWENGLPNNDARLPNENFAILATTETYLEAGRKYQARVRGDDGFQLLAQNQHSKELVYITPENNWAQSYGDHQEISFTVPSDGQYDLQVQFYEERGDANFDLSWEPVNFTGRTIATTNTNVRSGPSTSYGIVGKLRNGTQVTFDKWTEGEFIDYRSDLGTASSLWYRIAGTNHWISAAIIAGSP